MVESKTNCDPDSILKNKNVVGVGMEDDPPNRQSNYIIFSISNYLDERVGLIMGNLFSNRIVDFKVLESVILKVICGGLSLFDVNFRCFSSGFQGFWGWRFSVLLGIY